MKTKNGHCGEHRTYPATKMIPKERINPPVIGLDYSQTIKKLLKKIHTKRSRQYLKRTIEND